MIDPIVRWAGSKRQLLPTLLPILDGALAARDQPLYLEPFLGGGAVALNLPADVPKILADLCEPLMVAWREVRHRPCQVARDLAAMGRGGEADYYRVRGRFNSRLRSRDDSTEHIAAEFLYLNRTSFNGLWRVNAQGLYNVPWGKREKDMIGEAQLVAAAERLPAPTWTPRARLPTSGAFLCSGDGIDLLGGYLDAPRPMVVYADSPYDGTFDGYGVGGFDADDQRNLAEVLRAFADRGHAVVATNADTLLVRDLYAWADLRSTDEERRISADGNRDRAACVIITRNCG